MTVAGFFAFSVVCCYLCRLVYNVLFRNNISYLLFITLFVQTACTHNSKIKMLQREITEQSSFINIKHLCTCQLRLQ